MHAHLQCVSDLPRKGTDLTTNSEHSSCLDNFTKQHFKLFIKQCHCGKSIKLFCG